MTEKRTKMLTLWVTPDEHERLLARCDSPRLATWMREVCLEEKPANIKTVAYVSAGTAATACGYGQQSEPDSAAAE